MKINSVTTKNKTYPNFEAIKVAEIYSKINKDNTTFIYKIEKNKDFDFCNKLVNNLTQSKIERMQINNPNIKHFLKNAFNSFNFSDYAAIGIKNNKPFGLVSILSSNSDKYAHIEYLATWKTEELNKIKNGGRDLINFVFNKYKDKKNINLTPAFDSELFYYKFGFDYENEYERNQMSIDTYEIKKQLNSLAEKFTYKPIENERSEDLAKFITTI
ncbi:unknown [Clostridium sp. CAG:768]|nr:unknown [Clostridium sp. CAG:768]